MVIIEYITIIDRFIIQIFQQIIANFDSFSNVLADISPAILSTMFAIAWFESTDFFKAVRKTDGGIDNLEKQVKEEDEILEKIRSQYNGIISHEEYVEMLKNHEQRN